MCDTVSTPSSSYSKDKCQVEKSETNPKGCTLGFLSHSFSRKMKRSTLRLKNQYDTEE